MKRYTNVTQADLDFNVEEQLRRMIQWEVWDKLVRDSLSNAKVNPIQVDTLCEYIKLLIPPTVEVKVERTPYGCMLNMGNSRIFVIITPDDITVNSFEKLPSSSFIFDILKFTREYNNGNEYEWEYHFELPEVLQR